MKLIDAIAHCKAFDNNMWAYQVAHHDGQKLLVVTNGLSVTMAMENGISFDSVIHWSESVQ